MKLFAGKSALGLLPDSVHQPRRRRPEFSPHADRAKKYGKRKSCPPPASNPNGGFAQHRLMVVVRPIPSPSPRRALSCTPEALGPFGVRAG